MSSAGLADRAALSEDGEAERLRGFGEELDRIRKEIEAQVGEADVRHVRRLQRFSKVMEAIGRVLLHVSFEPITFIGGVLALWIHKQLQATEIGHTALHGAYDGLTGAEAFDSKRYAWDTPIDEESWRAGHNVKHHQYTNIAGRDPDIHFGPVRLTPHTPHAKQHRWQLPFTLFMLFPNFGLLMNLHFTGLNDVYYGNGRADRHDFLPDRSKESIATAHRKAFRKYLPYYAKNYLLFPLLAGSGFFKVLLGNWIAEVLRDVYSAATIYCGHVGPETATYPEGTRAHGRGAFYAMQIEASNNFEVIRPLSILCGGLDHQIEHHLFPRLPPERLRQIAPSVRVACERYGVRYHTGSWPKILGQALGRIRELSRPQPGESPGRGFRAVVREMV